jgi:hypothetical protein
MGVVGDRGEADDCIKAWLKAADFGEAVLDDSGVSAKETTRNLDTITDDGGELEEGAVRMGLGRVGGKVELAFAGMAFHANRVAEGVISYKEVVHDEVLGVPLSIRVGDEEARHVVSQGANDMIVKLVEEVLVDEEVEGNVEASRAENTAGARALSTERDTEDGVVLSIEVFVEAGGRGAIEDGEVLVGFRPNAVDTIENGLAVEFVEAFDGILGVNSIAFGNKSASEVGHDFGTTTVAKAILTDGELFLDTSKGLVQLHALEGLLEEGGTIVDGADGVLATSSSSSSLGSLVVLVEGSQGPIDEEEGDRGGDIGSRNEPNEAGDLEEESGGGVPLAVREMVEEVHGPPKESDGGGTFGGTLE